MQPTLINATLKYWLLQPAPALRSRVSCYFVVDAGKNHYHVEELLLPDGYSEIVFALAAGFDRWVVGEAGRCSVMRRSYLIGGTLQLGRDRRCAALAPGRREARSAVPAQPDRSAARRVFGRDPRTARSQ